MNEILLIGDIHGKWDEYENIISSTSANKTVQIGDFGIGFGIDGDNPSADARTQSVWSAMDSHGDSRYIRGNHDNPNACQKDSRCIPDATYDEDTGIFYLGGASSIDAQWRTAGVDWWEDEELSYDELYKAIDLYESVKPEIVVSHECSEDIVPKLFDWYMNDHKSRTRQALSTMFYIHKPKLHVFGHWHKSINCMIDDIQVVCLNELETLKILV